MEYLPKKSDDPEMEHLVAPRWSTEAEVIYILKRNEETPFE
jgi:hypothetical protein